MYDVLVIGSDLSSLLAALNLQKRHKKVALLRAERHTAFTDAPVHLFHVDPLPWTGLTEGGLLAEILNEHDIAHPHDNKDGALQIIFPERRIDFSLREASFSAKGNPLSNLHRRIEKRGSTINKMMTKTTRTGTSDRWEHIHDCIMRRAGEWIQSLVCAH